MPELAMTRSPSRPMSHTDTSPDHVRHSVSSTQYSFSHSKVIMSWQQYTEWSKKVITIVRENVWSKAKNVKSHVFWIFKKNVKKRNSNNMFCRPKVLDLNITLNQISCPFRNY